MTYEEYGRTGAGISPEELLFAGNFDDPPNIANFVADTILWDRGSQIWLKKTAGDSTVWSGFSGPVGFIQGGVYYSKAEADNHVSAVGDVVIYGREEFQNAYVVTVFTQAQASHTSAQWIRIDVTPDDLANEIARVRHGGDDSTYREVYSASKTYTRGQVAFDGATPYMLLSATATNVDPFANPNHWAPLHGLARFRGLAGSTAVKYYSGDFALVGSVLYFCYSNPQTNQTASTIPLNTASFLNLSAAGGGLNEAAVNALIASWARAGNTNDIPVDKIIWSREFSVAGSGTQWERGQIVQYTPFPNDGRFYLVRNDHQQGISDLPTTEDDFDEIVLGEVETRNIADGAVTEDKLDSSVELGVTFTTEATWTRNTDFAEDRVYHTDITPPSDCTMMFVTLIIDTSDGRAVPDTATALYAQWNQLSAAESDGTNYSSNAVNTYIGFTQARLGFSSNVQWFIGKTSGGQIAVGIEDDEAPDERGLRLTCL